MSPPSRAGPTSFRLRAAVRDDGTDGTPGQLIGYSIIEAPDITTAKELTDGLPFLAGSNGECTVEIFELLPM